MKEFRFTLTCENDAASETLHFNPEGWEKIGIAWKESEDYKGILRSVSLDKLGFIQDQKGNKGGKNFILSKYDTYGIEANITILIEKRDHSTMGWDTFYTGKLRWIDNPEQDDIYLRMGISDGSFQERFSENDEQDINLQATKDLFGTTITPDSYETITLKEQDLIRGYSATVQVNDGIGSTALPISEEYYLNGETENYNQIGDSITIPSTKIIYTNNTGEDVYVNLQIANFSRTLSFGVSNSGAPSTAEFDVTYDMLIQEGVGTPLSLDQISETLESNEASEIINRNSTTMIPDSSAKITYNAVEEILYYRSGVISNGTVINLYFTVTVTAGNANASDTSVSLLNTFDLFVSETLESIGDSDCNVLFPYEAFNNILKTITGVTNDLYSPIMGRTDNGYASDGELSLIGVTNGYQIRQFDIDDYPVYASFKKLFKSYYSIHPIYLEYDKANSRWVIDDISERYKDTELLQLEDIADFKRTFDKDYYYNRIKTGQKDKVDYEVVSGIEEFNTPTDFSTGMPVKNDYDIQSDYRLDGTGIEVLRRKPYVSYAKEDTNEDDINYLIECVRSGGSFVSRQADLDNDTILNILNASTHLNLGITPKRNLLNHESMISSIYHKNSSGLIQYMNSQIYSDLSTKFSGESTAIVEDAEITASSLADPYYIPETLEFSHPITKEIINTIETNPNGYITVIYEGVTYKGFLLDPRTDSYDRTGNWKLLIKYES